MSAAPSPPVSADDRAAEGAPSVPPRAPTAGSRRLGRILVAGALVAVLIAGASTVLRGAPEAGFVAPGVSAGGVDLGGRSEEDARAAVDDLARAFPKRTIALSAGGKELRIALEEVGAELDPAATTAAALSAGRERGLAGAMRALSRGRTEVNLHVSLDAAAVAELSVEWERALVDDPPFEGAIEIVDGAPVAKKPRAGHRIDAPALARALSDELARGGAGPVAVPLVLVTPPVTEEEVARAHELAAAILSGPITLEHHPTAEEIDVVRQENEERARRRKEAEDRDAWRLPKKKSRMKRKGRRMVEEPAAPKKVEEDALPETLSVTFTQADLLAAFRARRTDARFQVELDDGEVKKKLVPIVAKLFNPARDARFDIDAQGRVTVVPSRPGTRVDPARLVEALYQAASRPTRVGELPVDKNAQPKFTTEAAESLGIKGLVAEYTTHHPCCQPRVKNIHRIADMLDGTIVKAGETFSVNAAVGPRTLERGFVMAPSIGDGEMVDTPGGGVSQFATTFYNALFDGGYAVKERKPHSFYFNRYPVGIEATLSFPHPDLVFFNDTQAAALIRCEYGDTFIRVRIFGDNGGRKIDRRVSQAFDFTEPKTEHVGNPRRKVDEEKVKESGSHGFSVTVTRVITQSDGTRREEKRLIKYNPRPRVVEVHPCKVSKGEEGYTGEKCPVEEQEGAGGGEP